jgi:hypothetical protein
MRLRSLLVYIGVIASVTQACAQARNATGFINGFGSQTSSVTSIKLYDVTINGTKIFVGNATWGSWPFGSGAIRWYRNGLPVNRWYFVEVTAADERKRGTVFFLTPSTFRDFRVADINF